MDQIAELLKELAGQLGTTVEMLWPCIVAKMKYDWIGQMATLLFAAIMSWTGFRYAWKAYRRAIDEQNRLKTLASHWEYIRNAYKFNKATVDGIEVDYERVCNEYSKARAAWLNSDDYAPALPIIFTIAFGISAVTTTMGALITLSKISQLLAPEAAAIQFLLRGL